MNTEVFDWIEDFLGDKKNCIAKISDLIPDIFDNYFLINWNYGIIDDFPFDDYPNNKDSIENINKQINIDRRFNVFLRNTFQDRENEKLYRKTTIREIASKFNVVYSAGSIDKIKITPGLAPLTTLTKNNITKLIQYIGRGSLYLYVFDNDRYFWQGDWEFNKKNHIKDVNDYLQFQERTSYDSVSFLFDDKCSWCLATMEDFNHFILCGDSQIAGKLKLINDLEVFKINRDYKFE